MKIIYVATTKNEHIKTVALNSLDNLSNYDIKILSTPKEVSELLYTPYKIMIADKPFLNIEDIKVSELQGQIHFLDQDSETNTKSKVLKIYKTLEHLKNGLLLYSGESSSIPALPNKNTTSLNNKKVEKNTENPSQTSVSGPIPMQNEDVHDIAGKGDKNKEEVNSEKQEQTSGIKNALENNQDGEELEANISPSPVDLNPPYPEVEQNTLDRLKNETNWYDGDSEEDNSLSTNFYHYQENQNPRVRMAKEIDKRSFRFGLWKNNKTIGVWSPINSIGVTTFVVNFAIYMAKKSIQIAVVEALNNKQHLKNLLTRYNSMPMNWHSFAETLHDETLSEAENVRWFFKDVMWLPLGDKDFKLKWDREMLHLYFETAKSFDFVLIDLPTGKMESHTIDSLAYLDEIWIVVDNDYSKSFTWKKYIQNILSEHNLNGKIIFNQAYPFSRVEDIVSYFDLPLLSVIPSIHEQACKSLYESKPLIDYSKAAKYLKPSFAKIMIDLLGNEPKKPRVIDNLKRIFV